MAAAKKAAPKTAPKAKPQAEANPTAAATKMIDDSMGQFTDFAGKFSHYAEDGLKKMTEQAGEATEIFRELGARNIDFMSRALEQGVEATQSLTGAKDPREFFEIQSGFAKSVFSAYTSEVSQQAEMCMSAWKKAATPFMPFAAK